MFWRLVRLYLDPFALFKSVTAEPNALDYNRRHRSMLLTYARRWAAIAAMCAGGMFPLGALARTDPALCLPILGLGLGFSGAVCMLLLSAAVYLVLGIAD
jgi:hypothetical protein